MNTTLKNDPVSRWIIPLLYIIFFTGFIFSFRAVSSIGTGLLLVAGIVLHKGSLKRIFHRNDSSFLLLCYTLFFLLAVVSFFLYNNPKAGATDIQLKSGLLLIPLAVLLTGPFGKKDWQILLRGYCLVLAAASLYCLCSDIIIYLQKGDSSVFFYHQLVKPLRQHGVYYSIYTFIALVFLLDNWQKTPLLFIRPVQVTMIIFFSVFLFFLSSKIVLAFYASYLIYYFIRVLKKNIGGRSLSIGIGLSILLLLILTIFTQNPVGNRFREIFKGDPALAQRERYDPGVYFNGVQFRLLQWKLVPRILNDHKCWLKGAGAGNAQAFLDQQYATKNMWLGDPATGELGYRAYNAHNQFLESLLRYGIPGFIFFLVIYIFLIRMTLKSKRTSTRFILLLLLLYALVESVFETQYGILIFCFFPFLLFGEETEPTS